MPTWPELGRLCHCCASLGQVWSAEQLSGQLCQGLAALAAAWAAWLWLGCPWCGQGCVGCECTGNSVPCQEWRWGGRASTHQWAITEPEFWPEQADGVYTTGLLHFDFDITKRNWSRIQLFHNNVKHNLTPICHQGCERDILFLTFNLNALM